MQSLEDEYLLVKSLSKGEKRQVTLLGRAKSGSADSAHLQLFEFLNGLPSYRTEAIAEDEFLQGLGKGLTVVKRRMVALVMGALLGQSHSKDPGTQIDRARFEARNLLARGLFGLAAPVIRRGLAWARDMGEYGAALELLDLRRRQLIYGGGPPSTAALAALQAEERRLLGWLAVRQQLSHLHAQARAGAAKGLSPREAQGAEDWEGRMRQVDALAAEAGPDPLSQSLITDLRGQFLTVSGQGPEALALYTPLLKDWRTAPQWIKAHPHFYLELFRHYQRSIYFGTGDPAVMASYLDNLPPASSLPAPFQLEFQRLNFSHQMTLGLNQGRFEQLIPHLFPDLRTWLQLNEETLSEPSRMAFYYNMAITYFLAGDWRLAYQELQGLLGWKRSPARPDIRNFARVLEVILLYELGHADLNEYVARRSRRYFRQQPFPAEFEDSVVKYVTRSMADEAGAQGKWAQELEEQLDDLLEKTARPTPLLGLFETRIWLESRQQGRLIAEVFREYLAKIAAEAAGGT